MMRKADSTIGIVGALSAFPRRLAARALQTKGSRLRRGNTRHTSTLVLGRTLLDQEVIEKLFPRIEREGVYYGQCSELCGKDHAFMPITVEAVSKEKFQQWVTEAQSKFAKVDGTPEPAIAAAAPSTQSN